MVRDNIVVNDRQLACARINSEDGQNYLAAMAAAANFAWVNRSSMTYLCRQVGVLKKTLLASYTYSSLTFLWFKGIRQSVFHHP